MKTIYIYIYYVKCHRTSKKLNLFGGNFVEGGSYGCFGFR